ncbi:MAG: SGNH/GDSL hydrolase family protein [Lachnospiraceae bacterium]|nr:SGNH/GDSL hydrolase family protein [Lachnospiraceae bacterium]MBQ8598266.1 SGNH/GDSL hydrolase family protein [Lachnospiraceae bacterium]
MKKKGYKNALLGLLIVLIISGCGNGNVQSGSETADSGNNISADMSDNSREDRQTEEKTAEEITEPDQKALLPALETAYLTDEMYAEATAFAEGNLSRLAKAMRKAENGEKITVAVIGGSITEGYSASSKAGSWAALFYQWWTECFPDAEINYVNAGVGGTSSYLGVHRVQEDVLDHNPDVVVVEFSVNDQTGFFHKKSYDNLVRRILKSSQDTAVILLFTTQENGTSAQGDHALIGFRYQLPMLSYGNAVLSAIEAGELKWSDISPDNIHPNDKGHAVIGEIFYRYLNGVYERLDELSAKTEAFTESPVTKETYQNAELLCAGEIEPISYGSFEKKQVNWYFTDNWHTESGEEALVFEVEASHIGLVYQREVNKGYGKFDIYVDGTAVRTLDGDFANGWGSATEAVEIYASDETAVHTIEIRKNPDSEGEVFTLVGVLVSQM